MDSTNAGIEVPSEAIAAFCRKWNVEKLYLFGSATRSDFGRHSDVDLMVRFAAGCRPRMFGLVDMKLELEEIFGRSVDLVEEGSVRNPYRLRAIQRDLTEVYAA